MSGLVPQGWMLSTGWGLGGGEALLGGARGSGGDQLAGQGVPRPNTCSKGGQRPRSWRGFSVQGAAVWSPFCLPGPHRAVGRSCRPDPAAPPDSEPQVKQRSDSHSPWSGSGLCSAAGGSRALRARGSRALPECGQGSPRGSEKADQSQPEGQKVRAASPGFPFRLGPWHISL